MNGKPVVTSGTSFNTTVALNTGANTISIIATDAFNNSKEITRTVTRQSGPNQTPSVNAGSDLVVTLPASASLNGTISDDGLPTCAGVTASWTKVSGPGAVTFANVSAAATTASFSAAGSYVLRLTGSDTELSASDDVTVTVVSPNQRPAVSAGDDQTITLPNSANLTGSATDDGLPVGSTLSVSWSKVSGPDSVTFANPNAVVTTASFSTAGVYALRLTASDSLLETSGDVSITVNAANQAPVVNAGPDQTITFPSSAGLNGSATDDGLPAGSTLALTWSKVSGPGTVTFANPNAAITTASFSIVGIYVLRLTATDSQLQASDDVTIRVDGVNHVPVVGAGPDRNLPLPNNTMTLNGSVTDDGLPLGSTLSINWSQVSGPAAVVLSDPSSPTPHALFRTAGIYVMRLTASDGALSDSDEMFVNVISVAQIRTDLQYLGTQAIDQGRSYVVRVKLSELLSGNALPIKPVEFILNGVSTIKQTSLTGIAELTMTPAAGVEVVTGRVFFNEDGQYFSSVTDVAFLVSDRLRATRVVFQDNFDAEAASQGSLNYTGFRKWNVLVGSVDLLGNGFLSAASGLFLDMDGTTGRAGTIETKTALDLQPGDYVLTYLVAGNASSGNGPTDEMTISIGDQFNEVLVLAGTDPTAKLVRRFTVPTATTGLLRFSHQGADNHGIYLDNVLLTVTTDAAANEAPQVNAGSDQQTAIGANLVRNDGNEEPMVADQLSGWTQVTGGWSRATQGTAGFPAALEGTYFFNGQGAEAELELRQEINVAPLGLLIDGGSQRFELQAWVRIGAESQPDSSRVIVELRDANNQQVLGSYDSGAQMSTSDWKLIEQTVTAPVGTRWIRIRLIGANAGGINQAFFDNVSLRALDEAGIRLFGEVTDDALPPGVPVTTAWSKVSGPGAVTFADSTSPTTTAVITEPGVYVLRLTASDSELSAQDEVTITVAAQNQRPAINAGASQTITLPATAILSGSVTDDSLPAGSTVNVDWRQSSGSGTAVFANPTNATTTVSFSQAGVYVLRLAASDGEFTTSSAVVITVEAGNQAPVVNAGADQTVTLPAAATLNGTATDDGLPAGSNLTVTWSKVSGPGSVTFSNPASASTTATFSAGGSYVLRLTATDSALTTSDDVTITVIDPADAPPVVDIASPADGGDVTSPVDVTGSVDKGAWRLEYSLNSEDGTAAAQTWTEIASGTAPVSGLLGRFDPTLLLNGIYSIRLSSTDAASGQTTSDTISVVVSKSLKIGNFTLAFNDLSVPVAGLPIQIIRSYDSRDKREGGFGVGWTLGIKNVRLEKSAPLGRFWQETQSGALIPQFCLEPTRPHLVTITFPDNRVYKFQAMTSPQCQAVAAIRFATLTFTQLPSDPGLQGATLTALGGSDIAVDGTIPGIVNLIDANNLSLYNPTVFELRTVEGFVFIIDQGLGVTRMTDPNGNTLTINSNGITHSSGKSVVFTRDTEGRITRITDPNGNAMVYSYDANGDLISFKDRENNEIRFSYDNRHGLVTITDPRGIQPIRNDYDEEGRLIKHTDALGKEITYTHDPGNRIERISDRLGHETVYEYDLNGNVVRTIDPLGNVTRYTYDARDNKLTETNALGKTTTFTNDSADNVLTQTDPLGNVTRFTYNERREVLTVTDPRGGVTTNTYDSRGNLLTTRDALGNTTTNTYDLKGLLRTTTDALNNVTRFDYDFADNLFKQTDALGHETTFGYDTNGNRISQTTTRTIAGGATETLVTGFEYDKLNRLVKTTQPDGSTTRVEYNSIGQQSATIDQLGHRTGFDYDEMGRMTRTTYPVGATESSTYDAEGRRLTSTDRAGRVTSFIYDELGRLITTTYADNTTTGAAYDAIGRVKTTTDARGNSTRYEYDDANRRTLVKDALNNETRFTYDANGNQASMTDARGNTISFEYDVLNRRIRVIYADGTADLTAYDSLGRVTSKTDQAGKQTRYGYDSLSRLTSVTDALNQVTRYSYNELGNQLTQTDANNHTTSFEYDKLGRRTRRILPLGQTETSSYNAVGNLASKTDFNGKTTTYSYDLLNRLLSKTPDPSFASLGAIFASPITFTYTVTGRATMTDPSGTTTFSYDNRDRLITKATLQGTLNYSYDAAGNLVSMRSSNENGVSVSYDYDSLNRLGSVTDEAPVNPSATNPRPATGTTTFSYDPVGNLSAYIYPNGVATSYSYNTLNRLTSMGIAKAATPLASFTYTLGAAGNRLSVTELSGRTVNYGYDDLYRLTSEMITNDPNASGNGQISYVYDAVGNRLSRTSTLAAIPSATQSHDANDRLTSDGYDANGNTIASGTNTYAFDFENRIIALNPGTPNAVTFLYDGDGNRVAKTLAGITTKFLVDNLNPTGYAQVAEEVVGGAVQRIYVHGRMRINQTQLISGNWVSSFYGYDAHESVRLLTDSNSAVTDTYTYEAFGNLTASTGTTPNNFLYVGEQLDPNLGFYYLRARYMTPSSGRFCTMDQFEGFSIEPISLHKYQYANGDPTNRVDPTGNVSVIDPVVVAATRNTIQSIQIPILKKVVAALIIAVLVAGVVSGPGTTFEEHANRLNSMRVQLQQDETHLTAKPKQNTDPPGVTVDQMERALTELFFEGRDLIPGRLESDLLGAIARTGIWLRQARAGGGIPAHQTGQVHKEAFMDRNKEYRVDTENSFGHNLRQ